VWLLAAILAVGAALAASMGVMAQVITMPVTLASAATASPSWCSGTFVAHELFPVAAHPAKGSHRAAINEQQLAVQDLDGDGAVELVLAQPDAPTLILWNAGGLRFQSTPLPDAGAQAVAILDLDFDGRRDLLLIDASGVITWWQNQGARHFTASALSGVSAAATAMAWGDMDGDGDLDLATLGPTGLFYYSNRDQHFVARRLGGGAGLAALHLADVNADGRLDLVLRGSLNQETHVWLRSASSWAETAGSLSPAWLANAEENARADLNNDGMFDQLAAWVGVEQPTPLAVADLDNDRDLDLLLSDQTSALRLLENRLCTADSLQVALNWPQAPNRDAIGAQVTLQTSQGAQTHTLGLDPRATGATPRLHFGLPPGVAVRALEVRWPDGMVSRIAAVPRNAVLTIERAAEENFTLLAGP
jgi:hypothetical protein